MKKLTLLLLFIIGSAVSMAQESSHCNVNPMLHHYYNLDVKDATLKWAFQCDSTYRTDSIAIPQMIEDSVWGALSAVFNVQNMPERDSVIDLYCVHQYPKNHFVQEFLIIADRSYEWTNHWFNNELMTGIPIVDSIMIKYGFEIKSVSPSVDMVVFRTEQSFNIRAVCDLLKITDGIIYADPNISFGDGPRFTYTSSGIDRYLTFQIGWGDCMSGCIWRHIWRFKVNENCDVEYLGTLKNYDEDHPIGEPWNCNITGLDIDIKNEISVCPNPVKDYVQINNASSSINEFEIRSINGQIMKRGQVLGEDRIDVSDLVKGVYLIYIWNDIIRFESHKIIKL